MKNTINWFEIPVSDFNRAKKFYEEIFKSNIIQEEIGGYKMGFLPTDNQGVSGAIVAGDGYSPCDKGTLVYLNADGIIDEMIDRIKNAGGSIVIPRTNISPEIGDYAIFIDSEGNKIGLHTPLR